MANRTEAVKCDGGHQLPIKSGLIAVPVAVLTDTSISRGARVLYSALAASIGSGGPHPVAIRPLADRVGVSPRTAGAWVNDLRAAGHLRKTQRPGLPGMIELLSGGGPGEDPQSYKQAAA